MKKILYFLGSFLAVIGGIGSFGYLVWQKEWVIAAGVLVVCFAALAVFSDAMRQGYDAKFQHGNTTVEIDNNDKDK